MTPLRRALVTLDLPPEARAVFDAAYRVDHAPDFVFGSAGAVARVAGHDLLVVSATPETTGFLDARRIALLPRGAIVANVGRGAVVVDADLADALASGHVAAAGLDVFDGEPAVCRRFFDLPNVFMLPHIGSSTIETRVAMARLLVDGLQQYTQGSDAPNRIA